MQTFTDQCFPVALIANLLSIFYYMDFGDFKQLSYDILYSREVHDGTLKTASTRLLTVTNGNEGQRIYSAHLKKLGFPLGGAY